MLGYLLALFYSAPAGFGGHVYKIIHIMMARPYSTNHSVLTGFQQLRSPNMLVVLTDRSSTNK